VSYDALLQRNSTVLAYLICNASADLKGGAYTACEKDMSSIEHGKSRVNVSPGALDIDVARLSRLVHLTVCRKAFYSKESVSVQAASASIRKVAAQLPSTCDRHMEDDGPGSSLLERIGGDFDAAFLQSVGVSLQQPLGHARADKICFVDEIRLLPHHLDLLKNLTYPC